MIRVRDTWGGGWLERAGHGGDGDMVEERLESLAPVLACRSRHLSAAASGGYFARCCISRRLHGSLLCPCGPCLSERPPSLLRFQPEMVIFLLAFLSARFARGWVAGHVCGCPGTHGARTGRHAPARMIDDHRAYVLYVAWIYQLLKGNASMPQTSSL